MFTFESITSLVTLTAMETVLGIDNIIFIAILVGRLPITHREKIRRLGITLALVIRVLLLLSISWIMGLTQPWFEAFGRFFSGRDLILLGGGLFLIAKSTFEIHHKVEGDPEVHLHHAEQNPRIQLARPGSMLVQILLLDIVFSLDSVITAVGMANQVGIMIAAMLISMLIMLVSARGIGDFVERHPTIKVLALSFLLMIGVMLVGESMGAHIPKGYIYFAMSFSLGVEFLNLRMKKKSKSA